MVPIIRAGRQPRRSRQPGGEALASATSLPGRGGQGRVRAAGLTLFLGSASRGKRGRHQPSPAATNSGDPACAGAQTRGFSPGSWHCPPLLQSFLCTAAGRSSYSSTPSLPSPAHTSSRAPTVLRIKPALQTPGPTGSAPCPATTPAKC